MAYINIEKIILCPNLKKFEWKWIYYSYITKANVSMAFAKDLFLIQLELLITCINFTYSLNTYLYCDLKIKSPRQFFQWSHQAARTVFSLALNGIDGWPPHQRPA
jgi:hypothetical protein